MEFPSAAARSRLFCLGGREKKLIVARWSRGARASETSRSQERQKESEGSGKREKGKGERKRKGQRKGKGSYISGKDKYPEWLARAFGGRAGTKT